MMRILISLLFLFNLVVAEDLTTLLSAFNQKADLSEKTKEEGAGSVMTFTRADLDRMQVRSLKELIDYVPFMRYNENVYGHVDPAYNQYQPAQAYSLRVYLNDRELIDPYYGSILYFAAGMNLAFIDHIEIYSGLASYKFGIELSTMSIRLYTKEPKREETNLIGATAGSFDSYDLYGYSAKSYEDLSYLLYVSNREYNRKDIHNPPVTISRDIRGTELFSQVNLSNHRFELYGVDGKKDNFIGKSPALIPETNDMDYTYFSGGWYYDQDENGISASLSYSNMQNVQREYILDAVPSGKKVKLDLDEELLEAHLSKTWEDKESSFLLGFRGRYKSFEQKSLLIDDVEIPYPMPYEKEFMSSTYMEASHLLSDSHMLTASMQVSHYDRDELENEDVYGGRLGYIYNSDHWTSKTFIFSGTYTQEPYLHVANARLGSTQGLDKERVNEVITELIYKKDAWRTSFQVGQAMIYDTAIYDSTVGRYRNFDGKETNTFVQWNNYYTINSMHSIMTNIFYMNSKIKGESKKVCDDVIGGYITLMNTFGKWDLSNSFIFYGLDYTENDLSLNYNAAITYRHSRDLSFFVKGMNLFEEALATDYSRVNPITNQMVDFKDVNVYDRRVMIGVEYQF